MRYAIGLASSVLCFSLLLLGCGREDTVLGPDVQPLASAAGLTCAEVTDPEGDAVASDGSGVTGKAYQDIVSAEICKNGGGFVFDMDVAGSLRARSIRRHDKILQEWSWNINTDPATFPAGFPFEPGGAAPPEFIVLVLRDGRTLTGSVIDRRPLLLGQDARITPVSFHIMRASVKASVRAGLLGNPETFLWIARTNNWLSPLGTTNPQTLDRAPDAAPAAWPQ